MPVSKKWPGPEALFRNIRSKETPRSWEIPLHGIKRVTAGRRRQSAGKSGRRRFAVNSPCEANPTCGGAGCGDHGVAHRGAFRQCRNSGAVAGRRAAGQREPQCRGAGGHRDRRQTETGAFFTPEAAKLVTPGNFEDNLKDIRRCDWIIEAVTENLEIKRALMAKVSILRTPGTILSTNTSGIPLAAIAEGFDSEFRRHFLGTHFFNPPRYLHLLEVIPGAGDRARGAGVRRPLLRPAAGQRAWCPARTRPISSPTASAASSASPSRSSPSRTATPSKKWTR